MLINEYIQQLASEIEAGDVVPFVGAGVSMAGVSGIPAAWPLKKTILQSLVDNSITTVAKESASQHEEQILNIGLEAVMYRLAGDRFGNVVDSLTESIQSCNAFNEMHSFIASMVEKSGVAITTNFDELIEEAATNRGLDIEAAITESYFYQLKGNWLQNSHPIVAKLHGSVSNKDTIAVTVDAIAKGFSKADSLDFLSEVVKRKHILVFGYSGLDRDIMPVLQEHATRVTWIVHSDDPIALNPSLDTVVSYFPNSSLALNFLSNRNFDIVFGNTEKILRTLANRTKSRFNPKLDGKTYELDAFKKTIDSIPSGLSDIAIAYLLNDVGAYEVSCRIIEDVEKQKSGLLKDIETRTLLAKAKVMQTNHSAFKEAENIISYATPQSDSYSFAYYNGMHANILGYVTDYQFELLKSEEIRSVALDAVQTQLRKTTNTKESLNLKKVQSDLVLNLANVYFWKGVIPGDEFKPELMAESVKHSWVAMRIAREIGDFLNIAKLNENIAHVQFKEHLGLGVEDLNEIYERSSSLRSEALSLIEFLNDDRARYHSLKNAAFELTRMSRFEEALEVVKKLIDLGIRMNWPFAQATGLERLGDLAFYQEAPKLALNYWAESERIYKAAHIGEFYAKNVNKKLEWIG